MSGLRWMAVMLAFFLSTENSLATVDQNRLIRIVKGILREYRTGGMFSLAVSIPDTQNQNLNQILQQVFTTDPADNVKNQINNGEVYIGNRVVAATVLKRPNRGADHAESRVVDHLDHLFHSHNDLLLFYVFASPCVEKCSSDRHRESILGRINRIRQWANYAFVFSKVFKPRSGPTNTDEQLSGALQRLGTSIGLDNIFRCDWMQCTSCYDDRQVAQVAPYCVSDDPQPGSSHNLPSSSVIQPKRSRSNSPSQSGQGDRGKPSNDINTSAGVSTNSDSNTGGGQGGSGSGGSKGRRRRGKKSKNTNKGDDISSSQSGLGVRNTDVNGNTGGGQVGTDRPKVRKVGGRRVGKKGRGGGNKQKSQQVQSKKKTQTNKKKKTQNKGTTQWSQEVRGGAKTQSEKRQKSKQPQSRGKKQRGGEMKRINQPPRRGGKQRKG